MYGHQTGKTLISPAGKAKNCNSWAEYETPNSSDTARLCNGGWFKGDDYHACASKAECMAATQRAAIPDKRHLPVTYAEKPFGSGRPGSTVSASSPNLGDRLQGWGTAWSLPTSIPTRPTSGAMPQPYQGLPFPIQPPAEWPEAMRTPYAAPQAVAPGGITPTFLPQSGESIPFRLAKNIFQGMFGSAGWHMFDFARSVDMFAGPPQPPRPRQ